MMTKGDLERLAETRIEDAKFLLEAGKASSAYYLAGYSVELALKVCISKQMQSAVIPDKAFINAIYTHRLENLLGLAGLESQFSADSRVNPQPGKYWTTVVEWDEQSRYEFWDTFSAGSLIAAIDDPVNGVLQWVKKHW